MASTTNKDYYELLGVKKDASADEIKKAFRKAARTHHPDAGGNEETFKQINEAYEVLSDKEKREQYDQFGQYFGPNGPGPGYASGAGGGAAGNPFGGYTAAGGWPGGVGGTSGYQQVEFDMGDLGDIFGSIFSGAQTGRVSQSGVGGSGGSPFSGFTGFGGSGGGMRGQAAQAIPGQDLQLDVTISFDEAMTGTSRKVQTGQGKEFTVNIPAGANDGGKIKFRGKGGTSASGGPRGDLYVYTRIAPHAFFRREKSDVLLDLPLTISEAALGTTVTVPVPDGRHAKLKIPAGTQSGKVFRMKGKGAPKLKGRGHGDLRVKAVVNIPRRVNAKQRKLLEQLGQLSDGNDLRPW
ncbi:MAG: DnaJ domain-containing protein [Actinomycetes bacterium]|jgi:curved DNA-binding protein|nr:DnaJ domain-containing protein [Actinomycetes bacterium]